MTGEASPLSQALQEATNPNRHLMKALVKSMRKQDSLAQNSISFLMTFDDKDV